jgi:DNA-binding XRE family transcriptional regulator
MGMGYKIKEAREELKMTQEELAAKSGVSRTTISNLENGSTRATSTQTLLKIAKALGKTVDQIFFTEAV